MANATLAVNTLARTQAPARAAVAAILCIIGCARSSFVDLDIDIVVELHDPCVRGVEGIGATNAAVGMMAMAAAMAVIIVDFTILIF